MQKCKLQPTRRRSTNEFGQVENSCGRVRRLFGRGRVIKRVLNKKKVKLVRSDCKFAIASGRVRTSCNFHTVRRPSLRTSSDELQSRPDSFGLTAKSSGRVRTSLKLLHPKTQDSRRKFTKSDELQFRPDSLERNYCNLNPAVPRPSADEFEYISKSSGSISKKLQTLPDVEN